MDNTMKYKPRSINVELTTECPLRCPQCYCYLGQGKHIDFELASNRVIEAGELGVKTVLLSGGETLCYPHLYELIKIAKEHCGTVIAAFSGAYFTQNVYERLMDAGLDEICISLNGSTKDVNALTRDGYDLAINALEILQQNQYKNATLNWVMHSSNVDDFPDMIRLAERYDVARIDILGLKPDSNHELQTMPSYEQYCQIKSILRNYEGTVQIGAESCFSPLRAVVGETKLFGNLNVGIARGCTAGLTSYSINIDGDFSPCRHLEFFESYSKASEYWENSPALTKLRSIRDEAVTGECVNCRFAKNCKPCQAINYKLDGTLQNGTCHCATAEFYNATASRA